MSERKTSMLVGDLVRGESVSKGLRVQIKWFNKKYIGVVDRYNPDLGFVVVACNGGAEICLQKRSSIVLLQEVGEGVDEA